MEEKNNDTISEKDEVTEDDFASNDFASIDTETGSSTFSPISAANYSSNDNGVQNKKIDFTNLSSSGGRQDTPLFSRVKKRKKNDDREESSFEENENEKNNEATEEKEDKKREIIVEEVKNNNDNEIGIRFKKAEMMIFKLTIAIVVLYVVSIIMLLQSTIANLIRFIKKLIIKKTKEEKSEK